MYLKDLNNNTMRTSSVQLPLFKFNYISKGERAAAEASGATSLYAMLPSLGVSLGLSLILYGFLMLTFSNTPIEGMWAMISTIQLMSYSTLIALHLPQSLNIFFEYMESVHNFNKMVPNVFEYFLKKEELNTAPYTDQYQEHGFQTRIMLLLCGGDILVLILSGTAIIVLAGLSRVAT